MSVHARDKNSKKRIMFLTGTRADYGKLKSLIKILSSNNEFEVYIFATGMHMLSTYGSTYREIQKDGFPNLYTFVNQNQHTDMDIALANTITGLSNYVAELEPDGIVVHGDRLEALAGAIVGALRNIRVFHIEGGEVSGTIDESIRHAITKFSHFHFVANEEAKKRIKQLGEPSDNIYIFGSPDIDIMHSSNLPTIDDVKSYYEIPFNKYNILMYHPVTTEYDCIASHIRSIINVLLKSGDNNVVIYPNNDFGCEFIINEYKTLTNHDHFRIFPSMRFEYFLTLLKNSECMIGNSSSGIREAGIYGIPAIDLGTRQHNRYSPSKSHHIIHTSEDTFSVDTIKEAKALDIIPSSEFGIGNSNEIFMDILSQPKIWHMDIQKHFIDIDY
ncbi:MAG: UDP-N-acetylglucosamine 2-epimerase (hydrolyzing) [Lachnospiraceae bacterium]|nr:UDP-N-acetylglucosamine 2-epimerase (hydrolyzing) [Lachnospiraceae bacterium]